MACNEFIHFIDQLLTAWQKCFYIRTGMSFESVDYSEVGLITKYRAITSRQQ